jgi:hypothetical protein
MVDVISNIQFTLFGVLDNLEVVIYHFSYAFNYGSPLIYGHATKGVFATSTLVVTHHQTHFDKM